jgi:hypothetical protein
MGNTGSRSEALPGGFQDCLQLGRVGHHKAFQIVPISHADYDYRRSRVVVNPFTGVEQSSESEPIETIAQVGRKSSRSAQLIFSGIMN